MDYIIETENLTKRYGTATVVDKVNLHVPKGKIYGLLGRNGAGKTTAMKMMLQLAFPTEGTVRLFGTNYKENIHTLYSKVGSIIETPGFYSNLTGYENLQILAKLRGGVSKSGVEKALEVVGLHKEKRKVFSDYSLGMKQRLGIAAAIMHEPELLILDEPINGLDPIGIVEIRSFLSELSHNHGITIFISSHVLSEIEQIADIIGVMHEGHLVEEVNISELHKRNRKYIQFDLSDSEIAGKILENHYHMTDFTVQDGVLYNRDMTVLNSYPAGKQETEFVIPDTVTMLVGWAFEGNSSLEKVTVPAGVSDIFCPFGYCASLREIEVAKENVFFVSQDGVMFSSDEQTLLFYPPNKPGERFDIPETVTDIEVNAFLGNQHLSCITVPEGVTALKTFVFKEARKLDELYLPSTITMIDSLAFFNSYAQMTIYTPENSVIEDFCQENRISCQIINS